MEQERKENKGKKYVTREKYHNRKKQILTCIA